MILYYVRHGEPIYVPDSLTEYGRQQASALSKRFARLGVDEIYCSSSVRAKLTAEPTAKLFNINPVELDWAHENKAWDDFAVEQDGRCFWSFHQSKYVEKFASKQVRDLGQNWTDYEFFKATNFKRGVERINKETDAFMLSLGFLHDREKGGYEVVKPNNKKIAFFAHQGFGLAFLSSLLDIPYPMVCTNFDMGHSGVTVIYFSENSQMSYPRVLQLSNDSHLYKEEILKKYGGWIDI